MNAYVPLAAMKTVGRVQSANNDDQLMRLIVDVSRAIDVFCGRFFYDLIATRYYPGWQGRTLDLAPDAWVSFTSVALDKQYDQSYDTSLVENTDYFAQPDNEYPKDKLTLNVRSSLASNWLDGPRRIKIIGVEGWPGDPVRGLLADALSTLSSGVNASTLTIPLTSGTNCSRGQMLIIDSEQMYVDAITANSATVQRGCNGTTAAAHATAAAVTVRRYDPLIERACFMQVSRYWRDSQNGNAGNDAAPQFGGGAVSLYPAIKQLLQARAYMAIG